MRRGVISAIAVLLLAPVTLVAQTGLTVTQTELDCFAPSTQLRIEADVALPAGETIETVRVYFRNGCGGDEKAAATECPPGAAAPADDVWFWVDAWKAGSRWAAILPTITAGTEQIEYYTEVSTASGMTAKSDTVCVSASAECAVPIIPEGELQYTEEMVIGTTAPCSVMPNGFEEEEIAGVIVPDGSMVAPAAGGTILGMSPGTAAIVGGAVVVGGIVIENNQDDSPN